jgi:hypothetical protein
MTLTVISALAVWLPLGETPHDMVGALCEEVACEAVTV